VTAVVEGDRLVGLSVMGFAAVAGEAGEGRDGSNAGGAMDAGSEDDFWRGVCCAALAFDGGEEDYVADGVDGVRNAAGDCALHDLWSTELV